MFCENWAKFAGKFLVGLGRKVLHNNHQLFFKIKFALSMCISLYYWCEFYAQCPTQ